MNLVKSVFGILSLCVFCSCASNSQEYGGTSSEYASYFDIQDSSLVVISPYGGKEQTYSITEPYKRIICMSSSHVACLSAVDETSRIIAVSGIKYISNPELRKRRCPDVGYENVLDYERILRLNPDLVVAYSTTSYLPAYVGKLSALGVPVMVLYDHVESHPLARAEYIRLFGALAGCREKADSVFNGVKSRYLELWENRDASLSPLKVLINAPLGDAWYVPGVDSYMARIIEDAGGEILGVGEGISSSLMSFETAYLLSQEADIWLNPGNFKSREELAASYHMFPYFGPFRNNLPIYNNIALLTEGGGNAFWESGIVNPDLILKDLISIFTATAKNKEAEQGDMQRLMVSGLNYYIEL